MAKLEISRDNSVIFTASYDTEAVLYSMYENRIKAFEVKSVNVKITPTEVIATYVVSSSGIPDRNLSEDDLADKFFPSKEALIDYLKSE